MKRNPSEPDNEIKVAFATHDGETFHNDHFGDSSFFDIYEIGKSGSSYIDRIVNYTDMHEEDHADAKKARGIAELMKAHGVNVVASKIYGPNIKRIKKKFVCVLMNNRIIAESIEELQNCLPAVINEWLKGETRNHLDLRQK